MNNDNDTHTLSAKLNVVRCLVCATWVLHVEGWLLTAESHLPKLQRGPHHEADAEADTQSAENDRDNDLPSLPNVPHWIVEIILVFAWRAVLTDRLLYRLPLEENLYHARHRACSFDGEEANILF